MNKVLEIALGVTLGIFITFFIFLILSIICFMLFKDKATSSANKYWQSIQNND